MRHEVQLRLTYMLVGAASFWLPDIFLSALLRNNGYLIWIATFILPTTTLLAYLHFGRLDSIQRRLISRWMLAGIFFFGPPSMFLTATLKGGGAHTLLAKDLLFMPLFMLFPPYTFILSGYDMSILALCITCVGLLAAPHLNSALEQQGTHTKG